MMLDEEALTNQMRPAPAGPMAPPPQEGMDQELAAEKGREASPAEQKMYETVAKQALTALAEPEAAKALEEIARRSGPEQAIAHTVGPLLGSIAKAAQSAGVELPPEVLAAAAQPVVAVVAQTMAKAGLAEDGQALAEAAMQLLRGGDGAA